MTMKSDVIDLTQLGSPEVTLAEHVNARRSKRLNVKFDLRANRPTYTLMVWNCDAEGVVQAVPTITPYSNSDAAIPAYNGA